MHILTKTMTALMLLTIVTTVAVFSCGKNNDDDEDFIPEEGGGNDTISGGDNNDTIIIDSITGDWVDLGLPSGLLWATYNLGAIVPEDFGDYFAWGEAIPKSHYDWSTYYHSRGNMYSLTKYCSIPDFGLLGFTDIFTILQPIDDAASSYWGDSVHTPTYAEWEELLDNTTSQWTNYRGVSGRLFVARNHKLLFLPAAGCRTASSLINAGSNGYYWSSSVYGEYPSFAWYFFVQIPATYLDDCYDNRSFGYTIRPVCRPTPVNDSLPINNTLRK